MREGAARCALDLSAAWVPAPPLTMQETILSSCTVKPVWPPLSFPRWALGTSFLDCVVPGEGTGRRTRQGPGLALCALRTGLPGAALGWEPFSSAALVSFADLPPSGSLSLPSLPFPGRSSTFPPASAGQTPLLGHHGPCLLLGDPLCPGPRLSPRAESAQVRLALPAVVPSAATLIIVVCVGFLVLMVVLGLVRIHSLHRRVSGAGGPPGASSDPKDPDLFWDDSALTIIVNPMEVSRRGGGCRQSRGAAGAHSQHADSR